MPVPEFGQFVEYVTEPVYTYHHVSVDQFDELLNEQVAGWLRDDYQKVDTIGRTIQLDQAELDTLSNKISEQYYSDVVRYCTEGQTEPLPIMNNLVFAQTRPEWSAGIAVQIGEVYKYTDNLYEVIQAHTTQSDWTPDKVPALFKRYYEPIDNPWPWVQPAGAHDAYPLGARVVHNGSVWESTIDANVWEPGSAGAETLWTNLTPPPPTNEWQAGANYKVGDQVTYQGALYECLQAHKAQVSWEPPNAPALWRQI